MEYLLVVFLFMVAVFAILFLGEWLEEFDNIFANSLRNIINLIFVLMLMSFIGFIIYMLFTGSDGGCASQYYGTDCLDD